MDLGGFSAIKRVGRGCGLPITELRENIEWMKRFWRCLSSRCFFFYYCFSTTKYVIWENCFFFCLTRWSSTNDVSRFRMFSAKKLLRLGASNELDCHPEKSWLRERQSSGIGSTLFGCRYEQEECLCGPLLKISIACRAFD